jgi:hypothetical protein
MRALQLVHSCGVVVAVPITAEAQYPSGLQSNFFGLGIKPRVNTYMANAVAAIPFGLDRRWADIGVALGW